MTHRASPLQPLENQARFLVDLATFPHGPDLEGGKGSTAAGHLVKRLQEASRQRGMPRSLSSSNQRFSTVPFFIVGRSDS